MELSWLPFSNVTVRAVRVGSSPSTVEASVENRAFPISFTPAGMVMLVIAVLEKALFPMLVTVSGMVNVSSDLAVLKSCAGSASTLGKFLISRRDSQLLNAPCPGVAPVSNSVPKLGLPAKVTDSILELEKAKEFTERTDFGMVTPVN